MRIIMTLINLKLNQKLQRIIIKIKYNNSKTKLPNDQNQLKKLSSVNIIRNRTKMTQI